MGAIGLIGAVEGEARSIPMPDAHADRVAAMATEVARIVRVDFM
jgi:hypothetical protein